MEIAGGSKDNKATAQTGAWKGTTAQKFTILENADGTVMFINKNSGKALDVWGGKAANKQNIDIFKSNGSKAQKWKLKKI